MKESLVVIGMNPRALIQSAAGAGMDVVGIGVIGYLDTPPDVRYLSLLHDLGGLFPLDPDSFHVRVMQAAKSQRVKAVAYSGGFENYPDLIADLSDNLELLGNTPAALRMVRDPFRLGEVVTSMGLEMPQILPPGTQPDPNLRWLRKRIKSGAGHGIEPWNHAVPDDPEYVVQRWLEGTSKSASFIANGQDAKVFSITRQIIGDPAFGAQGFTYVGNLLLPEPDPALVEKITRLAQALTQAFGLVGLNGIDFILNGEQLTVLEVNPRHSASMELVEESLGLSLFEWHTAGCRGQALPELPKPQNQEVYGIATVHAQRDGILPDTRQWLRKDRRGIPYPSEAVVSHYPICKVTAVGGDEEQCYANLLVEADDVLTSVKNR